MSKHIEAPVRNINFIRILFIYSSLTSDAFIVSSTSYIKQSFFFLFLKIISTRCLPSTWNTVCMYIRSLKIHLTLSCAIDEAFFRWSERGVFHFRNFPSDLKKGKERKLSRPYVRASVGRNRRYFRAAAIILLKRRWRGDRRGMSCTECWYSWVVVPAGTRPACFGFCLACRGVPLVVVFNPPG